MIKSFFSSFYNVIFNFMRQIMYKHIVMWKFNLNTSLEEKEMMVDLLNSLVNKIKFLKKIEVALNSSDNKSAYDIVLTTEFNSEEDYKKYAKNKDHIKVVEFIKDIVSDRTVVDYTI